MERIPLFRALISVFIGTTLGLQPTLAWWGNGWWQIAVSCLAGAVFGMAIADYRRTALVFQNIGNWLWQELQKLDLVALFLRTPRRATPTEVGAVFGAIFLVLFTLFWVVQFRMHTWLVLDTVGKTLFAMVGFSVLGLAGILGAKWGKWMAEEEFFCGEDEEDIVNRVFKSVIKSPQTREEMNAVIGVPAFVIAVVACLFYLVLKWLLVLVAAAIVSIPGLGLLILYLPLMVIHEINQKRLIRIAASIVIGILIGTTNHSRLWGWASGLAFYGLAAGLEPLVLLTAKPYQAFWRFYRRHWETAYQWAKP